MSERERERWRDREGEWIKRAKEKERGGERERVSG